MASDGSFNPPPGKYIGLWKNEEYSDVLIQLVHQADGEEMEHKGTEATVMFSELPVHRSVLKESSSYFEGLMATGTRLAAAPVTKKRKFDAVAEDHDAACTCACHERTCPVYLIPCKTSEEAMAVQNVVMYMYTHALPSDLPLSTLQMASAADYLGSELCLTACLHALGSNKQEEVCSLQQTSEIISLVNRQPQPDDVEQKIYQRCVDSLNSQLSKSADDTDRQSELLMSTLLECFGDVWNVIQQDKLRLPFCCLSLPAIQLWGTSSALQVDCENSIVVLLTSWWKRQPANVQTPECKKKLSALVRLPLLSHSYLQYVVNTFSWFTPPVPEFKAACVHLQQTGEKLRDDACFLNSIPRTPCKQSQCLFDWEIPLGVLLRVACAPGASMVYEDSHKTCWKGFSFWLRLSRHPGEDCLQIEFGASSHYSIKSKPTAFAIIDFEIQSNIGKSGSMKMAMHIDDNPHWVKVLQLPQLKTQDIATELAGKLSSGNSLLVTAIVGNVF